MSYIFIVNPVSGNNFGVIASLIIEEYCKEVGVNYKIFYTSKKNDATNIASSLKYNENYTIFSVGGDGTLNEVVNGLPNSKSKLGVIPVGTGNDFYKSFKFFEEGKIDLCKVNDRYFVNVASIGLDAEIANYANKMKNNKLSSKEAYILSLIHEYFSFKPININLESENKNSTILTVCNAKYYGGGFKIDPQAILNDGLFDVIDVKSLNKLQIIEILVKLLNVKHLQSKHVNFYRTNSLNISSMIPLNCNVDGEIIKDTNFEFSIAKQALNVDVKNSNIITNVLKLKGIIK